MPLCTVCKESNPATASYCNRCGSILDTITVEQKTLATRANPQSITKEIKDMLGLNDDPTYFGQGSRAVLVVRTHPSPLEFTVPPASGVILGRLSSRIIEQPVVDLTTFGAHTLGVSRSHAELIVRGQSLRIRDLDSTNGTFVNGSQLLPRELRGLNNGDHLQLGNLVMRILFRHQS